MFPLQNKIYLHQYSSNKSQLTLCLEITVKFLE